MKKTTEKLLQILGLVIVSVVAIICILNMNYINYKVSSYIHPKQLVLPITPYIEKNMDADKFVGNIIGTTTKLMVYTTMIVGKSNLGITGAVNVLDPNSKFDIKIGQLYILNTIYDSANNIYVITSAKNARMQ